MSKSEPIGHLRLTSTTKAAAYLNTTDGHIRQLIAEGRIKGYRVGRLIKVDANEIEAFIVPIDNGDVNV